MNLHRISGCEVSYPRIFGSVKSCLAKFQPRSFFQRSFSHEVLTPNPIFHHILNQGTSYRLRHSLEQDEYNETLFVEIGFTNLGCTLYTVHAQVLPINSNPNISTSPEYKN